MLLNLYAHIPTGMVCINIVIVQHITDLVMIIFSSWTRAVVLPRTPSQTKPDFVQTEIIIHLWNKMKQFMISESAVFELVPTGKSVFPWKKVINVHVRVLNIKSNKIWLLLIKKGFLHSYWAILYWIIFEIVELSISAVYLHIFSDAEFCTACGDCCEFLAVRSCWRCRL